MSILELISEENPILFEKSEPVVDILSAECKNLIEDLVETSMSLGGYGLAAPQVGINQQVFVYRKAINSDKYKVVINPGIVVASGKLMSKAEGCLSHPGFRTDVRRFKTFILKGFDENGEEKRIKGTNKKESCILQHEFEHLMGITIKSRG